MCSSLSGFFHSVEFFLFEMCPCCVVYTNNLFLFIAEDYSIAWMYQFAYPFTCWWTFGLIPAWGLFWIKLLWTFLYGSLYGHRLSFLLIKTPRHEVAGSYGRHVKVFKKLPNCFPKWLYPFASYPLSLVVPYPYNTGYTAVILSGTMLKVTTPQRWVEQ